MTTPDPGPQSPAEPSEDVAEVAGDPGQPTDDATAADTGPETDAGGREPTAQDYESLARVLAAEAEAEPAASPDIADEPEPASEEAKRYRLRLRETEAQLAALKAEHEERLQAAAAEVGWCQDRLERVWRGEVERLAAAKLEDPQDIWLTGTTVEDLQNADGHIDSAKVAALCEKLTREHPHWAAAHPIARRGLRSGASNRADAPVGSKWQEAFSPKPQ